MIIVVGGDVNRFDINEFIVMIGWDVFVDFLIRGDAYLDKVFINRSDLFVKSILYFVFIKIDYIAVILLVGTKLKSIR